MVALWQARRWRHLWWLIQALPRNSRLVEAQSNDEQLADELAAQVPDDDESPRRRAPAWTEFSPEVEALYIVADRVSDVATNVAGLGSKKAPRRTPPLPRPRSLSERAAYRKREREHQSLTARLLPDGPQPAPAASKAHAAPPGRPRS